MGNIAQQGKWEAQKDRLKVIFATLSEEDFQYNPTQSDNVVENIQCKTGRTRAELARLISLL